MILSKLSILNYKNIAEATLEFSPKVNCLLGNNGMGKTNVLDAIFYLSFCQSSLARTDATTVRYGEEFMLLQGEYVRSGKTEQISCALQRGKKKSVKRNGKEYRRQSEHIGLLPLVMVTPSDWNLIAGGSEERRRLIDRIISQGNHEYLEQLIGYNRALEQRNAMLKQGIADPLLLETVDTFLCQAAAAIHKARQQWIERFTPIFMRYYNTISDSNEQVRLDYRSVLNTQTMAEVLRQNLERDRVLGHTSMGVHRDDIELMLGDELMRRTGSQGQCKTYTIALRLAQFDFLKTECGQTPILLLDDIFDKLDANRVANIMRIVSEPAFGQILCQTPTASTSTRLWRRWVATTAFSRSTTAYADRKEACNETPRSRALRRRDAPVSRPCGSRRQCQPATPCGLLA